MSIITINYNNALGLEKTLESVINQTYNDFEYLVIDGGSTDGSKAIIEKYADNVTYWVSEKDKGIYNAMNKGILQAKGEYCLFLNSGDWLVDNNSLDTVFSLNITEDIIYGNVLKVSNSSLAFVRDKGLGRSQLTLMDMYYHTIPHQSVFIKRELFNRYELYDEEFKIVSDWIFFLKTIGIAGVTVKYIDVDISYYDTNGFSSLNNELRIEEKKLGLKKVIPHQFYGDYLYMAELKKNKYKISFYDKLFEKKSLLFFIRLVNKLFKLNLWKS
ncbi:MAG: glycosyltransferase [Bacteroidetes bacterium]|nr:glycosyltransferase [Bacteroidota bacterium]